MKTVREILEELQTKSVKKALKMEPYKPWFDTYIDQALSALEALWPELMSEERLTMLLGQLSRNYSGGQDQWELEKCKWFAKALLAKALTIAKPQVMDLDKVLPKKREIPIIYQQKDDKENIKQLITLLELRSAQADSYNQAIDDCRKALANMPKVMSVEEVEYIITCWRDNLESYHVVDDRDIEALASKLCIGKGEV